MRKFLLAAAVAAFCAADSQACLGQLRASRQSVRTVAKTKTVERVRVLPAIREIVASPLRILIARPGCK